MADTTSEDIGLLSQSIPKLAQILKERLAALDDPLYKAINVTTAYGRITQADVQELGADTPQLFISMTNVNDFDDSCLDVLHYTATITLQCFGGGCSGLTKHVWARTMMTLAIKIILKYGHTALDEAIDSSTLSALSLDNTQSNLDGLGIWSITFQARDSITLDDI
jgi:hypothetical protein